MEFKPLLIFTFLSLVIVGSYADDHPSKKYWESLLPYTQIPQPLQDILKAPTNVVEKNSSPVMNTVDTPLREDMAGIRSRYLYGGPEATKQTQSILNTVSAPLREDMAGIQSRYTYGGDPKANKQAHPIINTIHTHPLSEDMAGIQFRYIYGVPGDKKDAQLVLNTIRTPLREDMAGIQSRYTYGVREDKKGAQPVLNTIHTPLQEDMAGIQFRYTYGGRKANTVDTPLHEDMAGIQFRYTYGGPKAAVQAQLVPGHPNCDISTVSLFFFEKDLRRGKKMNLYFPKSTNDAKLLPRQVVESVPFSLNKFPEILAKFRLSPTSNNAGVMFRTIQMCELDAMHGEERLCATSMESMVDFSTSKLGKDVKALSTTAAKGETQEYTIMDVKKIPYAGDSVVICHKMQYPYAVYYCHTTRGRETFKTSMEGADGSRVDALVLCHKDTSEWNPNSVIMKKLKEKPGGAPICHFLQHDHVMFVGVEKNGKAEQL